MQSRRHYPVTEKAVMSSFLGLQKKRKRLQLAHTFWARRRAALPCCLHACTVFFAFCLIFFFRSILCFVPSFIPSFLFCFLLSFYLFLTCFLSVFVSFVVHSILLANSFAIPLFLALAPTLWLSNCPSLFVLL